MVKERDKKAMSRKLMIISGIIIGALVLIFITGGTIYHQICNITLNDTKDYYKAYSLEDPEITSAKLRLGQIEDVLNNSWNGTHYVGLDSNKVDDLKKEQTDLNKRIGADRKIDFKFTRVFSSYWWKKNLFFCKEEQAGFINKSKSFIKDKLGFNETIWDFIYPGLVTGILMFLWIYLTYKFAVLVSSYLPRWKRYSVFHGRTGTLTKLKNSWMSIVAGKLWKLVPVAVGYAIIMQIPIINSFIDLITIFDSIFFKSIVLAFYLGFLPQAIEEYARYKLRKDYYQRVLRVRYRQRMTDALSG